MNSWHNIFLTIKRQALHRQKIRRLTVGQNVTLLSGPYATKGIVVEVSCVGVEVEIGFNGRTDYKHVRQFVQFDANGKEIGETLWTLDANGRENTYPVSSLRMGTVEGGYWVLDNTPVVEQEPSEDIAIIRSRNAWRQNAPAIKRLLNEPEHRGRSYTYGEVLELLYKDGDRVQKLIEKEGKEGDEPE